MSKDSSSTKNPPPDPLESLGFVQYTGSVPFEELEFPNEPDNEDFNWAWNSTDLQKQYSGLIVAVYQRTVWGAGRTFQLAWEDAQKKPNCPPRGDLVFVPIM